MLLKDGKRRMRIMRILWEMLASTQQLRLNEKPHVLYDVYATPPRLRGQRAGLNKLYSGFGPFDWIWINMLKKEKGERVKLWEYCGKCLPQNSN